MPKKNLVVAGGKKKFSDVTDIIKNPSTRSKLQSYIDESVRHKVKILDENESIKNIKSTAVEELGIAPKLFSALVALHFNNNFDEKKEEIEQLETAIEMLQSNLHLVSGSAGDEEEEGEEATS